MKEAKSLFSQSDIEDRSTIFLDDNQARPYTLLTFSIIFVALAIVLFAMILAPNQDTSILICLLVSMILFGWSELIGACGSSHASVFSNFYLSENSEQPTKMLWLKCTGLYTISGIFSAATAGYLTGLFGSLVQVEPVTSNIFILFVAIICLAREANIIRFNLPQVKLQTNPGWSSDFGYLIASAMWGTHIGIAYVTVIAHCGFYIVVALSLFLGPELAALLFVTYWVGRTLPLWLIPLAYIGKITEESAGNLAHRSGGLFTLGTILGILICIACVCMKLLK